MDWYYAGLGQKHPHSRTNSPGLNPGGARPTHLGWDATDGSQPPPHAIHGATQNPLLAQPQLQGGGTVGKWHPHEQKVGVESACQRLKTELW